MLDIGTKKELQQFAQNIRLSVMEEFKARGFGHVGGSLSLAEVLAVLYGKVMKYDAGNPEWEERDYFVLSKGHGGPALYAALALKGFFDVEELKTLNQPGTKLPSHPDRLKTRGVDITTGSLGQGVSEAMGVAVGLKRQGKENRVYVIVGDGESNEGQVWEAALFAHQYKLDNVILFVDNNGKQIDGLTKDVCDMGDFVQKYEAFGWHAESVDGHDVEQIYEAIERAKAVEGKPSAIVLNTTKGKGVRFIEDLSFANHYMIISQEQVNDAITELMSEV